MAFREGNETKSDAQELLNLDSPVEDDSETKVRLDDADDDDDGDDKPQGEPEKKAAPGDQPRKKDGKWAEKKAERGKDHREERQWQKEKVEYDRRIARLQEDADRRFKQLTEEFDRFRQTNARNDNGDPFAAKLSSIEEQLEAELRAIEQDPNRGYKHYNNIRRQEQELITQRAIAMHAAEQMRQQQSRPQNPYAHRQVLISAEFPWTDDNRYNDLTRKAQALREYLINVEGKPDTVDTDREALTTTVARFGAEFGLRPPPAAPTQRTRSLWQGPASRGAPDRRPAPKEVELGEVGRGHGLSAKTLAALVSGALNDQEN